MQLPVIRDAFIAWIVSATGFATDKVVWQEQNMPRRLPKPGISIKINSIIPTGREFIYRPDNTGSSEIYEDKIVNVSIECYGDKARTVDPLEVLTNLHASLHTVEKYKILQDAGIAFSDTSLGPADTTALLDIDFEERTNMDLIFIIPWSTIDANQGFIEKSVIEQTTINIAGITVGVNTITVDAS